MGARIKLSRKGRKGDDAVDALLANMQTIINTRETNEERRDGRG